MNTTANSKLRPYAQKLRREMTKEERHLWYDFLRSLPVTFHRQKVIGSYIVDFYCADAKLVIELDGSQHYESAGLEDDRQRNRYLAGIGLRVLRYSNADVNLRFEQVCEDILNQLKSGCD
jgi:very-short-patch-repair endonuclease